ncbi:MAG: hypothetical protein ACOYEV_17670 [Candidatus Nanopelagicales bacterium]
MLLASGRSRGGDSRLNLLAGGFLLMSLGALLQASRGSAPEAVAVLGGNIAAGVGVICQAWAVGIAGWQVPVRTRWLVSLDRPAHHGRPGHQ